MKSREKDRAYLEAGVPELGQYLLSNELYWPVSARGYDLPRLTIGGLLLAQTRLEAHRERIEPLVTQLETVRSKWRVAWETKAGREFQSRFGLWSNYLADYRQRPERYADAYPHEVRYRVMLHLLQGEMSTSPPEQEGLIRLDGVLRTSLSPGEFIWDADLIPGFPPEVYWYLYGKLKS